MSCFDVVEVKMELEISDCEKEVQLANRQHLFSLLAFLEDKVSDYCEVNALFKLTLKSE